MTSPKATLWALRSPRATPLALRSRAGRLLALRVLGVLAMVLATTAVVAFTSRAPAEAQQPPAAEVRVDVAPQVVTLGDRVRITVIVAHSEALLISVDPPSQTGTLQLIETLPADTVTLPDGSLRTEVAFTVAAFELGAQQLDELRVFWLREDGSSGELRATPAPFEVTSALAGDPSQLRPLKPQATFGEPPPGWLRPAIAGGVLLVVAAVVLLGVRRWLRRAPAPAPPAEQHEVAPETAARRRLEELAAGGTLASGDYERFYGTLSVVLRDYLEERFAFTATALTTPELDREMGDHGVERWQARLAGGLLDRCDAAIYASRYPDPSSADHDLTVAFEVVALSRARRAAEVVAGSRVEQR